MRKNLSRLPVPTILWHLLAIAYASWLIRDRRDGQSFLLAAGPLMIGITLPYLIRSFRWFAWDNGSFVIYRLFQPTLRVPLEQVEDLRESTAGAEQMWDRSIFILRRGDTKYIQAAGGALSGASLEKVLEIPGIKEEFRSHLLRGEKFRIGSSELRLEGDTLFIKNVDAPLEKGALLSSMRLGYPTFGEQILHYDEMNSLSLGREKNRSVWQLLLLEVPSFHR